MSGRSLKAAYQKWLWLLATADLVVVLLFLTPGLDPSASLTEWANWRLLVSVILPVVVLLLVNALPHKLKCMLVYWRAYGWLPGCVAFTKLAPHDVRIDMKRLEKNVGGLPKDGTAQNARWYQLYKLVEDEEEVRDVHRNFLMYRDMAALSLPFIVIAPVGLYLADASASAQWTGGLFFLGQYLLAAVSARWSGGRLVCNVLALHSVRKVKA